MKKIIILILALCFIGQQADGQPMSRTQERHVNGLILELLGGYEQSVLLYNDGARRSFLSLFESREAPVYCDFIDSRALGTQIPASKYAEYAASQLGNAQVDIKDLVKDSPQYYQGRWHWKVHFKKEVKYVDPNEILFSSKELIEGGDFLLTMDIAYDVEEDRCFISKVEGKMDGNPRFPAGKLLIVKKNDGAADSLLMNGKPLDFNSFGQAIVSDGKIVPANEDIYIKKVQLANTDRYEYVEYFYRPKNWRFRPHYAFTLGSAFHVDSAEPLLQTKSRASEMGLDLGVAIMHARKMVLSLNLGAALSMSSIEMSVKNASYTLDMLDAERHEYKRSYRLTSANEAIHYQDWAVPLYLSLETQLFPRVKFLFDLGGKGYVHWKTNVTPYHVEGSVDGNSQVDRFARIDQDFTRFLVAGNYARRNKYDFTTFARAGLEVNVYKAFYLYGKFGFEYSFTDLYAPAGEKVRWLSAEDGIYPIVYNAIRGEEVATRSFIRSISFSRRALSLETGLMIKF